MLKFLSAVALTLIASIMHATDPLPSWNDTAPKRAIIKFVEATTTEGSPEFVPPAERVAVFDNDGTLWSEQPLYVQAFYLIDRIKALAPQHPEWATTEPFASLLQGDMEGVAAAGGPGLLAMLAATHAGMTTEEFEQSVNDWITTAKHPKAGRLYTEMVYQPMLELLDYFRANGYKTYIVSGGGIDFMRPWTERTYGIPPEHVVGSSGALKYEVRDGTPVIVKVAELALNNDKEGKPVGIQRHIGRRPIASFGNSDGDYEMLEWTTAGQGLRLSLIVHHTDAERDVAYDRESPVGRLAKALDDAPAKGWIVVDVKNDWNTIHPPAATTPATLKP